MKTYVYFASYGKRGPIKIGFSVDPELRLKDWSTGLPYVPTLLAQFPGSQKDEAILHKQFAAYRLNGEWFRRNQELLALVKKYAVPLKASEKRIDISTPLKRLRSIAVTDAQIVVWAGCSRQAVSSWRAIPTERVLRLEKIPEIGMTRHQMRPDIFGATPLNTAF